MLTPKQSVSFWSRVNRTKGCWLWRGATNWDGYGRFRVGTKLARAHRVSYEEVNGGRIPAGFIVMHTCDEPRCVRPSHLRLGTHAENIAEREAKGRGAGGDAFPRAMRPRRQNHGCAKLTDAQVAEIRQSYAAGGSSHASLARKFGVSKKTVTLILNWKTWKPTPDDLGNWKPRRPQAKENPQ